MSQWGNQIWVSSASASSSGLSTSRGVSRDGTVIRSAYTRRMVRTIVLAAAMTVAAWQPDPPPAAHAQLVIVVDGLRPDYVTPALMPRLTSLGRRGVVFNAHHSVFPTVTRVNASSMVTGTYPESHGLLGNTVYIPAVNATRGLDTGSRENLEAIGRANGP